MRVNLIFEYMRSNIHNFNLNIYSYVNNIALSTLSHQSLNSENLNVLVVDDDVAFVVFFWFFRQHVYA